MKLQEQMRQKIKLQGKSAKTFETYWKYCAEYIRHVNRNQPVKELWKHPKDAGRSEIEAWLTSMAVGNCAKNTQNTALQAVLYLYREVLGIKIENVSAMRSKRPQHTREVMSVEEVSRLFDELRGIDLLAAQLMYGCGLRISDVVGLRLKDISFDRKQLSIKAGKGDKWRFTCFPEVLHESVARQIESVRGLWKVDQSQNPNGVALPDSFRKKSPSSANDLRWYWLFLSENLSRGEDGVLCRWHRHEDHIARQISLASKRAGIMTRVTSHVLRHSYATHAHEQGVSMRTLMELLGHIDIRTTEIYVHADKHLATAAKSPLESLVRKPPLEQMLRNPPQQFKPQFKVFAG
jgi:integron integrase